MKLDGLTMLVTGAARGIGAEIAMTAARRGARVMLSDLDDDEGRSAAARIESGGGTASYTHCDVTDETQVEALMERTAHLFGGLDVLVNNAGIHEAEFAGDGLSLEAMTASTFERVLRVNLIGPWLCSKHALRYLKDSENPSIINAASVCSFVGYPNALAYGPSKGGVALLTMNLAVELASHRIRVNAYCPSSVDTRKLVPYTAAGDDPEATRRALTQTHLIPRLGRPTDIANVVCFLASDDAAFMTGTLIKVDGGSLAWRGVADEIDLMSQAGVHQ